MLWLFDRDDQSLTVETRYDSGTSEFVFIVQFPDSRTGNKRFTDPEAFGMWLKAFERQLADENWSNRGRPIIVPHRWQNGPKR